MRLQLVVLTSKDFTIDPDDVMRAIVGHAAGRVLISTQITDRRNEPTYVQIAAYGECMGDGGHKRLAAHLEQVIPDRFWLLAPNGQPISEHNGARATLN